MAKGRDFPDHLMQLDLLQSYMGPSTASAGWQSVPTSSFSSSSCYEDKYMPLITQDTLKKHIGRFTSEISTFIRQD